MLKKANEIIEKLTEENESLKNKNSNNSSKLSSTNMVTQKKTGADLYNYRIKSSSKFGHTSIKEDNIFPNFLNWNYGKS